VLTVKDAAGSAGRRAGPNPHLAAMRPLRPRRAGTAHYNAAATFALGLLTLASASGLERVFTGHSWLGPVLLAAITVHTVCSAARRWRVPQPVALVVGLAAVWLITAWTILGPYTHYGIPDSHTFTQFTSDLRQAHEDFATAIAPVVPTEGFRLLATLGTAAVAFLGDWIAFRWKSVLLGAAPAFALFIVCCTTGQGSGRQWAVAIEVTALVVFMLAHRAAGGGTERVWFAGRRVGVAAWATRAGGLTGGLALLTALLVTPLLASVDGVGLFGWRSGAGPGTTGPRIVANPVVDLRTRLIDLTQTPVFTFESPVPSYWRLTSLDTFNGETWTSTGSYRSFGARLPGIGEIPAATRTVKQVFQIENLDSVWLPDAFNPVSVQGVRGVSYDPSTGSLITASQTSNGLDYTVTSYQYLSTLDPADLEAAPPLNSLASLKSDLELPSSVSPLVIALAKTITAGKTTEYDKAVALQNYFRSAPFVYSLNPVSDGTGTDALDTFLFTTHSGYCQQFAGAYAVLARAAGLPTRLAVGFATGRSLGGDSYQVLDADAHTWPEVYFGPQFGWLPFEPTPNFIDPGAGSYLPTSGTSNGSPNSAPDSSPLAPKGLDKKGALNQAQRTPPTTRAGSSSGSSSNGHNQPWSPVLLVVLAIPAWIVLNAAGRRLRWRFRRIRAGQGGGGPGAVLSYWADVSELLAWWGVARRPSETDDEFARRAANRIGHQLHEPSPWLAGGVVRMAGLAREAAFAATMPPNRPREAALVTTEIRQRLFRSATARQLLAWAFLPRPGRRASEAGLGNQSG
jgi:transglutaminase-like putative cysteine protease